MNNVELLRRKCMLLNLNLEIGLWNGWILVLIATLTMYIPLLFMKKDKVKREGQFPTRNRKEKLHLAFFVFIYLAIIVYSIFTPLSLKTPWFYAGLVGYIIFLGLWIVSFINFMSTPEVELVTKGIYSVSRHPMYITETIVFLFVGVACSSLVLMGLSVLYFLSVIPVMKAEEEILEEKYEKIYQEYVKQTPRIIIFK